MSVHFSYFHKHHFDSNIHRWQYLYLDTVDKRPYSYDTLYALTPTMIHPYWSPCYDHICFLYRVTIAAFFLPSLSLLPTSTLSLSPSLSCSLTHSSSSSFARSLSYTLCVQVIDADFRWTILIRILFALRGSFNKVFPVNPYRVRHHYKADKERCLFLLLYRLFIIHWRRVITALIQTKHRFKKWQTFNR